MKLVPSESFFFSCVKYWRNYNKIKTFTIGFESKDYDESFYAKEVANHLKTDHSEYILSSKEVLNTVEDEKITLTSFGNDKSALVKSNDPNQTLVLMPLLL